MTAYFHQLGAQTLLTAEDELRLARELETLEIETWVTLLRSAGLAKRVLPILTATCDAHEFDSAAIPAVEAAITRLRKAQKGRTSVTGAARAVHELGKALRAADLDRTHIDALMRRLGGLALGAVEHRALLATQAVDRAAQHVRTVFIEANLRLVVTMAKRFDRGQMPLPDLIQEGNLGLMHAVSRYEYQRGLRFSTYACWWIRHAIGRAVADKGRAVRVPVHMQEAQLQLEKARRVLTRELGRPPTQAEVSKAARLPAAKISQMHQYIVGQGISLDKPMHSDDDRTLGDSMSDPDTEAHTPVDVMNASALSGEVRSMLKELSPIEADVITKRFGIGDDEERTFREIGDAYDLSRERIRQIQNGALDKLKRALERRHRGHVDL